VPNIGPLELVVLLGLIVAPPVVGYRLGVPRGHEVLGLVLGLLLSWLGVLIVALLPKREQSVQATAAASAGGGGLCSSCGSRLPADARYCASCGAAVQ
jgi:hypothetical protein